MKTLGNEKVGKGTFSQHSLLAVMKMGCDYGGEKVVRKNEKSITLVILCLWHLPKNEEMKVFECYIYEVFAFDPRQLCLKGRE